MTDNCKRVHFIGVGGVGMSGIARVAADAAMRVSGSDMKSVALYRRPGCRRHSDLHRPRCQACDRRHRCRGSFLPPSPKPILSLVRARELGIAVWRRRRICLPRNLVAAEKTLAACGTRGKTTTSSMLATATDALGLEPTFVVGGIVDERITPMPFSGQGRILRCRGR